MENIFLSCAAAVVTAAALLTVKALSNWVTPPSAAGRFPTIDGLRGYLGFFVFLHHANFWKTYAAEGVWRPMPSTLFTLFGSSSVKLFFMITGFLFFSKILHDRGKGTDFIGLLISRIMRLTPLYLIIITLMVVVIFFKTGWQLNVSPATFLSGLGQWVEFTMTGDPDLNGFHPTSVIMSGVYWTLPHEWVFYMSLPILAIFTGERPKWYFIVISIIFLVLFGAPRPQYFSFIGGMLAAIATRSSGFCKFAEKPSTTFVAFALFAAHISLSRHRQLLIYADILLAIFFVLIASGNSLFGALTHTLSRSLGEYTYGIYLTHGLLLFVTFSILVPNTQTASWSLLQYWTAITAIAPLVILISAGSYVFVERPAIAKTKTITTWLQNGMGRSRPRLFERPIVALQPRTPPRPPPVNNTKLPLQ